MTDGENGIDLHAHINGMLAVLRQRTRRLIASATTLRVATRYYSESPEIMAFRDRLAKIHDDMIALAADMQAALNKLERENRAEADDLREQAIAEIAAGVAARRRPKAVPD